MLLPLNFEVRLLQLGVLRLGLLQDGDVEWELHRFRNTFACWHHERNGVSVNTLREWLGHESLDVTLAYLKGSEAASEPVQEQVANGALAAYL